MARPIRETARGVILKEGKFLLIRRTRRNNQGGIDNWLSIPGGGLDAGESPEHAIIREMKEELGIDVDIKSLLAVQDVPTDESRHYYFLCTIRDGEPHIQEQSEEYVRMQGKVPNTYAIEWTDEDSPNLPGDLFHAYAEAYIKFKPFIKSELREPLGLHTN